VLLTGNSTDAVLSEELRRVVDWDKDLPEYVFRSRGFKFLFFERPIIDNGDLLFDLISSNAQSYTTDAWVSFGSPHAAGYAQFYFDEVDLAPRVSTLQKDFRDFFGGSVDYPVLMTNKNLDWIAFESSHEELGVLAVRSDGGRARKFIDRFKAGTFIACEQMEAGTPAALQLQGAYGRLIQILHKNYCF